jgi:plasmid stabilization system protein ParE
MPDILYTPRYDDDLVRIYKYSAIRWGKAIAMRTMDQIAEVEQKALADPDFGKLDSLYHSPIYRYATIPNSQTVFFHRLGDDVVMITAGYKGRAWNLLLKRIEPEVKKFIEEAEGKR